MNILAVETSCDETALSIMRATGSLSNAKFRIQSNIVLSQAKLHAEYGGVFPNVAKREHAKNLTPVLEKTLAEAGMLKKKKRVSALEPLLARKLKKLLTREPEMYEHLAALLPTIAKPNIHAITVTSGPGLEPALWVGINFAKALSLVWNIPVVPVNHMEGHILSAFVTGETFSVSRVKFPVLALLISGGHTELVLMKDWMKYKVIGATRDDAVGEAFDKVARMLGLAYPGGPEISKIAETGTTHPDFTLPRPMIASKNFDFSFSGLKTAVLYAVKQVPKLTKRIRASISKEFEQAVTDVLVTKTMHAAEQYGIRTLVLGGGVTANKKIRRAFAEATENRPGITLLVPSHALSTDNAVMIGVAGFYKIRSGKFKPGQPVTARGNMSFPR